MRGRRASRPGLLALLRTEKQSGSLASLAPDWPGSVRFPGLALIALVLALASGCARPYSGPKTLAAIATGLLAVGGATWVIGERAGRDSLVTLGAAAVTAGAAGVIGAGGWLAASISCGADPDCPTGEECKEIPAPPGGIPYKQCMRR